MTRRPLLVLAGLAWVKIALATSTLSFANARFAVQIVVTSNDTISDFRLYDERENGLVCSANLNDLEDVHYDPAKKTLRLVFPACNGTPGVALVVRGKKATLTYRGKRAKLKGDWVM